MVRWVILGFFIVSSVILQHAEGDLTNYQKIAESGVMDPGGTFIVKSFGYPALSHGKIVFGACAPYSSLPKAIYSNFTGTLEKVADYSIPVPGISGAGFTSFSTSPAISRSGVFFRSGGLKSDGSSFAGIYSWSGNGVGVVVDSNTPIPGGTGVFRYTDVGFPAASDDAVAFIGRNDSKIWISDTSGLHAFTNTILPGQTKIISPDLSHIVEGTTVAFTSLQGPWGFATVNTTGFSIGVDLTNHSPAPNCSLNGDFGYSDGQFAFSMETEGGLSSLFLAKNENIVRVLDWNSHSPDGGFFRLVYNVALDDDMIVFSATTTVSGSSGLSLFTNQDGLTKKILGTGDILDNKTISGVCVQDSGVSDGQAAVLVIFEDRSQAIYVVPVPEPATLSLLALGGLAMLRRRCK